MTPQNKLYSDKKILPYSIQTGSESLVGQELTKSTNGPFFYYDNTYNTQKLEDTKTIHRLKSIFSDGIGYVRIPVIYGSHASVCLIGDLHFSTSRPEINDLLFKGFIKNSLTDVLLNGDILQMPTEGHHPGEAMESKIIGFEEANYFFNEYVPYFADKCKCAVGGTHDSPEWAARMKQMYFEVMAPYYENAKIPYWANSAVIEYVVPVIKNNKIIDHTSLWIVLLHCSGKPGSKKLDSAQKTFVQGMGVWEKFKNRTGVSAVPHYIFGGHFHANSDLDQPYEAEIINPDGKPIGTYNQTIRVRSNSTVQDSSSSSFNRGFPELLFPNYTQYDFHFIVNEDFNSTGINKNPRYELIAREIPIFNRVGQISIPAKEYMNNRKILDPTEFIKESYKGQPFISLCNEFNAYTKGFEV